MSNNEYDHLITEISNKLINYFFTILSTKEEFKDVIDSSSLLNMTLSIFLTCILNVLDNIKENTIAELLLINNIDLIKNTLIKAINDLPFITHLDYINEI